MDFSRINIPQAILVVAVLAIMGAFVKWGPEDHRATVATALVGALTTIASAFMGRMIKRDPAKFEEETK
jgi:fluoride ion exporter CrcB/FEX